MDAPTSCKAGKTGPGTPDPEVCQRGARCSSAEHVPRPEGFLPAQDAIYYDHCVLAVALLEYGSETNWVACMIPTPSGVGTETR